MASRNRPSVLIVEDDVILAMTLALIVEEECGAETRVAGNVATAEAALVEGDGIDFAFLDINVIDGNTYHLARRLCDEHVPFAFVSGSDPIDVPVDLRGAPFLAKPCPAIKLARFVATAFKTRFNLAPFMVLQADTAPRGGSLVN